MRLAQVAVVLSAALVAGCFNGGSSTPPAPATSPTPLPFTTTQSGIPVLVSGGTQTITGPTSGGFSSGLAGVFNAQAGTTVTVTTSDNPPNGIPAGLVNRDAQSARRDALATGITTVLYETYTTTTTVTETGNPVFTIGLPAYAPTTGVTYYLAILENGAWQYGYAVGVINAGVPSVTLTGAFPITFTVQTPVYFKLYYQASSDPAPTTPPTPTPAPSGNAGVGIN
jgi:hypothetical protein